MYPCRVEKRVWRTPERDSGYSRLVFNLEVESTPKVGLELNEGCWFSGPVTLVLWDEDNERFVCRAEDEFPVYDQGYDFSYDWIMQNYQLQGWRADGWKLE